MLLYPFIFFFSRKAFAISKYNNDNNGYNNNKINGKVYRVFLGGGGISFLFFFMYCVFKSFPRFIFLS